MRLDRLPVTSISPTAPTSMPARAGTRCAKASRRTCRAIKAQVSPERAARASACGSRRSPRERLSRARRARRAARLLAAARLLRVHASMRFPYGAVSRDAREGGRLPARLARRRRLPVQRPAGRHPRRAAARTAWIGQRQHRARHLQGGRGDAAGRGRADGRRDARGTPPHLVALQRAHRARDRARARAGAVLLSRDDRGDARVLRATTCTPMQCGDRRAADRPFAWRRRARRCSAISASATISATRAVEFEDPADAFARLADAGIRVAKLQLSSGAAHPRRRRRAPSERCGRSTTASTCTRWSSAGTARSRATSISRRRFAALRAGKAGGEWRVHCHVPVFLEAAGEFRFDAAVPERGARLHQAPSFVAPHLEVETYTWDVLPPELRAARSVADAIAREMRWVLQELA